MSWTQNPYLTTADPGSLDFEVRRNGRVLLSPNDGRFGDIEVSYRSTSNGAPFDPRHQFISIRQLAHSRVGPLVFRLPWSDDGIRRALRLAIVTATTSPRSFRTQSGTEFSFRSQ